jgi:hypothetical protein
MTFLLAFVARMTLAPLCVLWSTIGVARLFGAPLDTASEVTLFLALFVSIGLLAVVALSGRVGRVAERMSQGPAVLGGHSVPIMLGASISSVGGLALLVGNHPSPAMLVMVMSTIVFVFESVVVVSMVFDPSLRSPDCADPPRGGHIPGENGG